MNSRRQILHKSGREGFSLVEVALTLGIVGFGMVVIIGLLGTALQSNKEVVSQDESFAVTRSLPGFLKAQGFATVYLWVRGNTTVDTATTPAVTPIFAYHIDPVGSGSQTPLESGVHSLFIRTGSESALTNDLQRKSGRLFRITLGVSPNMAVQTISGNVARPTTSNLPSNVADYLDASLAVQVNIYEVPMATTNVTNLKPLLTYDATVPR